MEASAKVAGRMLGDAWLDIKQARAAAEHLRDSMCRPEWAKPIVFPWEDAAHGLDSENAAVDASPPLTPQDHAKR